jgi:hypothetical protein
MYYLQKKGHDLLYGHIEMEIILKMECGLDVEFTPDWGVSENHSDYSQVQWELSNCPNKDSMDGVLIQFPSEESLYESSVSVENLRLLHRHNKGDTKT